MDFYYFLLSSRIAQIVLAIILIFINIKIFKKNIYMQIYIICNLIILAALSFWSKSVNSTFADTHSFPFNCTIKPDMCVNANNAMNFLAIFPYIIIAVILITAVVFLLINKQSKKEKIKESRAIIANSIILLINLLLTFLLYTKTSTAALPGQPYSISFINFHLAEPPMYLQYFILALITSIYSLIQILKKTSSKAGKIYFWITMIVSDLLILLPLLLIINSLVLRHRM